MHKLIWVIIVFSVGFLVACSESEIIPTADQGSDCVAARIVVQPKQVVIPFFTDRCNAPNEEAYVSFNGNTHQVWRLPGNAHPDVTYAGTWKGENIIVSILPRKLIERFEENRVIYEVDVIIKSDNKSATISAIYDNRM